MPRVLNKHKDGTGDPMRNYLEQRERDLEKRIAGLERENDATRRANEGLGKALWVLRDLLSGIDAELDRQLHDERYVRSMRNNDLDIHPDCEHHVIIREAIRAKISEAVEGWAERSDPPTKDDDIKF